MCKDHYKNEKCLKIWIFMVLLFGTTVTSMLPSSSLFRGLIAEDQTFKVGLRNAKEGPVNVFGWVKIDSNDKKQSLPILTISRCKSDMLQNTDSYEAGDDSAFISVITLNNRELIVENKWQPIKYTDAKVEFDYEPNKWYFLVLTIDNFKGELTIFISSMDDNDASKDIYGRVGNFAERFEHLYEIEINFNSDELGRLQKPKLSYKDFSIAYGIIKSPRLMVLMFMATLKRFEDFILDFKTENDIQQLKSEKKNSNKPLIYEGDGLKIRENEWPLFTKNSILKLPNVSMFPSSDFSESKTLYLKFKFNKDMNDEFILVSTGIENDKSNSELEIRLLQIPDQIQRRLVFVFQHSVIEFSEKTHLNPGVVHELFLSVNIIDQAIGVIFIKVGDFSQYVHIKLKHPIHQKGIKILSVQNENKNGEVEIYRIFISENPIYNFINDIFEKSNKEKIDFCLYANEQNYSENTQCLICDNQALLNPYTHKCVLHCPSGRKNDMGICIECHSEACAELNQKEYFEVSEIENYQILVKIKPGKLFGLEADSLSNLFNFVDPENTITSLPFSIQSQSENEVIFLRETLNPHFNLKLNGSEQIHDMNSNSLQEISWSFPLPEIKMRYLVDLPVNTIDLTTTSTNAPKKKEKNVYIQVIAFILIGVFAIGIIAGIIGCLMPFSIARDSYYSQKIQQSALAFQFICFWSLSGISIQFGMGEFLDYLYKYSIWIQQIFVDENSKLTSVDKSDKYSTLINQGINSRFLSNFGLLLIIQIIVASIFLILSIFQKKNEIVKNDSRSGKTLSEVNFSTWIYYTKWKAIFGIFFMFLFEATAFAFIEFSNMSFSTPFRIASFVIAVLICTIIILQMVIIAVQSIRTSQDLIDDSSLLSFTFCLQNGFKRSFLSIHLLFYIVLSIIAVMPFSHNIIGAGIEFGITTIFTLSMFFNFQLKTYWQNEQKMSYVLLWLARTFLFSIQLESLFSFMNPSVAKVLSHSGIFFCAMHICWNSVILVDSLIREINIEKSRVQMHGLFTIKTVCNEEIKVDNPANQMLPSGSLKNFDMDRSAFRLSAMHIFNNSEVENNFVRLKSTYSSDNLDRDDVVMKEKLASLNFPSKLAQLKFCKFINSETQISEKLNNSKANSQDNLLTVQKLNQKITEENLNRSSRSDKLLLSSEQRDQNGNSKSKGSTQDTTSLRPMDHEASISKSKSNFDFTESSIDPQVENKFNEILTQSKLVKLKDSVSFAKKKYGVNDSDTTNTESTILKDEYLSSHIRDKKLSPHFINDKKISCYSEIGQIIDNEDDEEDHSMINDLGIDFNENKKSKMLESEIVTSNIDNSRAYFKN
jgi:hypothetical protein